MSKDLIVKDNKLIRAKYSLSLHQTRFIAHMAEDVSTLFEWGVKV